jgi:hypothetical protein
MYNTRWAVCMVLNKALLFTVGPRHGVSANELYVDSFRTKSIGGSTQRLLHSSQQSCAEWPPLGVFCV